MVAADITRIIKIAWAIYLGALSRLNAIILIPRISAHPPILTQCKGAPPVALYMFREGTVHVFLVNCWGGASACTTSDKSKIGIYENFCSVGDSNRYLRRYDILY